MHGYQLVPLLLVPDLSQLWDAALSNATVIQHFQLAVEDWVCDSYSIDVRYLAGMGEAGTRQLWEASIEVLPLPFARDMSFRTETAQLHAGQLQLTAQSKKSVLRTIDRALQGSVEVYGQALALHKEGSYDFHSEMTYRDRWFSDLHLQIIGGRTPLPAPIDVAGIDNALRRAIPPFDGLADVAGWLGFVDPSGGVSYPSIRIRVGPPVDLIFSECHLANDRLTLTLHAHPKFDVGRVGLAVRAAPGDALVTRRQVASEITWKRARNGRRVGVASVALQRSDSALAILMIGGSTVRRQWFIDPAKAGNSRLIAVQHFDKDLRMIKQAVLEPSDSMRFEVGVAALLFLLGFSPAVQLETDSPDVVVSTPGGKLAIVECTTRIADFSAKLGKLVDRRGALSKALQSSGHRPRIDAVLVCALPRDQIAAQADELQTHKAILLTREDLVAAFERVRQPNDPDKMLDDAIAQLSARQAIQLGS